MTASDQNGQVIAQSYPAAGQAWLLWGLRSPVIGPALAVGSPKSQPQQAFSCSSLSQVIPRLRDNAFRSAV